MVKIKNKKILLLSVLTSLLVIAGLLTWMTIAGGCLGFERIKMQGGNARVDIGYVFLIVGVTVDIFSMMIFLVHDKMYILSDRQRTLLSSRLLI